jgi:hypothetical protein
MTGTHPRAGRAVNFTLSNEADEYLRQIAPAKRKMGEFVSRLILEERVRREERKRLQAEVRNEIRQLLDLPELEVDHG